MKVLPKQPLKRNSEPSEFSSLLKRLEEEAGIIFPFVILNQLEIFQFLKMYASILNSSIHYEAHQNYIRGVDENSCRFFYKVSPENRCKYISVTAPCNEGVTGFNYGTIIFCDLSNYTDVTITKALLILSFLCFFYILFLMVLTLLVIPNVLYLLKGFQLSQHNAGATLLILFYGLPDIFASFIQFQGDTELLVNEMMGISLYLRAFQSGLLIFNYPFAMYGTFFIRDAILFAFGIIVLYTVVVNEHHQTSIFEGIFAIVFYPALCYLVYLQHFSTKEARRRAMTREMSDENRKNLELTKEITYTPFVLPSGVPDPLRLGIFSQFLLVANVYNKYNFSQFARWQKNILILGFYFAVPIKFMFPIVHPMAVGNGWSRLLIAINLFVSPLLYFFIDIRNNDYFVPTILIGSVCSVLFLYFTRTDEPKFLMLFAFYGFVFEVWTIRVCESEINALLLLIGNIVGLKRTVTACTLLSWGDCVPEVVGSLTMIRWKLNALPLAGFLMAPLFNMIFVIGAQIIKRAIENRSVYALTRAGDVGQTCTWFTCVHHFVFCFAVLCTNFRLRKSVGIYSILVYLLFMFYLLLNQRDFIHAYGTDHINEGLYENKDWA